MKKIEIRDRRAVTQLINRQKESNYAGWIRGLSAFNNGLVEALTLERDRVTFLVTDRFRDFRPVLDLSDPGAPRHACDCGSYLKCCHHVVAAFIHLERLAADAPPAADAVAPYTRGEMLERVLEERRERARTEPFRLQEGPSIYGPHEVVTGRHKRYEITIRDFDRMQWYCSCPDFRLNKLGTCKHLMFAHAKLHSAYRGASESEKAVYPYFEIFCDPLQDYKISFFYKGMTEGPAIADACFHGETPLAPTRYRSFLQDLEAFAERRDVVVRPEVIDTIEEHCERQLLRRLEEQHVPDLSWLRADLYEYQRQGIRFAAFRKGSVIADDMGLGKTLQAMAAACLKREIFDFRRALVVCPASLKEQWRKEIEKFTGESAVVAAGGKDARRRLYEAPEPFFVIANYETVLRDVTALAACPPDLVILDEAQRIKNYETKTAEAVKSIPRKHAIVITGTPLENKLIDLYSIMGFVDPKLLAPLWEFSLNHCIFDKEKKNRVTGYFNLQALKDKLKDTVIRREKREVLSQLPPIRELNVPVTLSAEQAEVHAGFARSVSGILRKKHLTLVDLQRIQKLLLMMRMTCDSTYLVDGKSNFSPKLDELESILAEKLDLVNNRRKVLIFSEWKDMLTLISHRLARLNLGHVILTGDVPVEKRGALIAEFESNPECRVFLSTEAGGAGLNLQVADTVINFDLPWNPAKKNQRIGRIDRLGQKADSLLVISLVALNSVEARIADGIGLKQELFDAVLKECATEDVVNFAQKGKATFFTQMRDLLAGLEQAESPADGAEETDPSPVPSFEAEPDTEADETGALLGPEQAESGAAAGEGGLLSGADAIAVPELLPLPAEGPLPAPAEVAPAGWPEPVTSGERAGDQTRDRREDALTARPETGVGPGPGPEAGTEPGRGTGALPPSGERARGLPPVSAEALEQTLNQGLSFLSGVLQMATGQALAMEGQSISVDRATGEVTLKFRLPGFN
ncbi:MAG: DEAD/DEAH box helicase family protein [Acidobacteria bacterium]|nr:DEAD/DEAH box helicase family protein [Acidobacteriota bacterium]